MLGRVCKKEQLAGFVIKVLVIHGLPFVSQLLQTRPNANGSFTQELSIGRRSVLNPLVGVVDLGLVGRQRALERAYG